jgi:hypothetical protein
MSHVTVQRIDMMTANEKLGSESKMAFLLGSLRVSYLGTTIIDDLDQFVCGGGLELWTGY